MSTIFLTGFPGFLGSRLVPRILDADSELDVVCLIQARLAPVAQARLRELERARPGRERRVTLLQGDVTRPDLGLGRVRDVQGRVTHVFHLAAAYDLSVERELARRVNVEGTRNVLRFAEACPHLDRFHHMSTCYVSGRHPGVFAEEDLDVGQEFNNAYEETKFLAESEVRRLMNGGMPGTVYRPGIVVGDSRTGATQKYDGPYPIIRWLLRQPRIALMPVVGDPREFRANIVPRDFVVAAVGHLAFLPRSRGTVYQLAESEGLTVDGALRELARATGRRVIRVPLSRKLAKAALRRVPGLQPLMQIPPAAVDYFAHPTLYTSENSRRDLEGTGIQAPPFSSYAQRLVDFVIQNPGVPSEPMV